MVSSGLRLYVSTGDDHGIYTEKRLKKQGMDNQNGLVMRFYRLL